MPLMSTLSSQATLSAWLLRAAELSDAEPSWSTATFTFYDDASVSPRLRAEGEDALANSADTDSCASEHEDDNVAI
ncbi:hypothetical protein EWM64_g5663 [Hericium alpestre]|uniref:Uncharacterized protein n=1 Tax=Hericium alpestre TaxID=135208 RepID=A0A4Y9ZU69_9AGAM|nr:hypothetical protein EWM64_g5663 [Hericium alpestre]